MDVQEVAVVPIVLTIQQVAVAQVVQLHVQVVAKHNVTIIVLRHARAIAEGVAIHRVAEHVLM